MNAISLNKIQQLVVEHAHTDFRSIRNIEDIVNAISVWQRINWYWSYSDQASTLRHGEEQVNNSLGIIEQIGQLTGCEAISGLAKISPIGKASTLVSTVDKPDVLLDYVERHWPWLPAYHYVTNKKTDLAVQLHLANKLDEVNSIISTIEGILTQMVRVDMSAVYNNAILDNDQVQVISKQAGILPNRLYTNAMYLKGISVSGRLFAQNSAVALFAIDLWNILVETHSLDDLSPRTVALTVGNGREFALSFRTCHLYGDHYMLMLYVGKGELSFAIPLMCIERK